MNTLSAIGLVTLVLFCLAESAYAIEQAYDTDLGKIKLDLPMMLVTKEGSTGSSLDLVKEGSVKPVVSIRVQEPYGQGLKEYAATSGYKNPYTETMTKDGHNLAYYIDGIGNNAKFVAFIDYLNDKGKIVQIWTYAEVHGVEGNIANFKDYQFLEIAKSFAVTNDS